jgi:ketopantoate reductase
MRMLVVGAGSIGGLFLEAAYDQILGELLRRGAEAGLDTPLIFAAYTHLCVYQNRNTATRSTRSPTV